MWSRRRFLEAASTLPVVGGIAAARPSSAEAALRGSADYFRDLGVRPFINAAGTYTAMTASLMPKEVLDAIQYAARHYVMLDELHDKVGQRIASLLHCEAAMVTCGAASALTLGTAAILTGKDPQKIVDLPNLAGMKSEAIIQKSHRFGYDHAVRNCGVRLVEVETADDVRKAVSEKTALMLFYNNNNSVGQIRDEEFVRLGKTARRPHLQRRRGRRASRGQLLEVHEDGLRPGDVLRRQGHPRAAEQRDAARPQGPDRGRAPPSASQREHGRPGHEGQQGGDARPAGGARAVPGEGPRARATRVRQARRGDPGGGGDGAGRQGRSVRARDREQRPAHPRELGGCYRGRGRRGGEGDERTASRRSASARRARTSCWECG